MNTSSNSTTEFAPIAIGAALLLAACGASDSASDAGSSDGEVKADAERVAEATAILAEVDQETGPTEEQQTAADDTETDDAAEALEDFARSERDIELGG